MFSWGRGDNGRLGLGTQESHQTPCYVRMNDLDFEEEVLDDMCRPFSIQCGTDCSMIVTCEGKLLCTGSNRSDTGIIFTRMKNLRLVC